MMGVPAAPDLSLGSAPGLFAAFGALLLLFILRRYFLGRLVPSPAGFSRAGWRDALEGAALAALLLAATLLPAVLAHAFRRPGPGWEPYPPALRDAPVGARGVASLFLVQSLSEELTFRGVIMGLLALALLFLLTRVLTRARPLESPEKRDARLARGRQIAWLAAGLAANPVQAVLFALLHIENPHASTLALVNVGLAGLVLGWLYWSQGALWGAWTFHFVWNLGLAGLGFPVSGLTPSSRLLDVGISGARLGLLSGGFFGPEGSVFATLALGLVLGFLITRDVRAFRRALREAPGYPSPA